MGAAAFVPMAVQGAGSLVNTINGMNANGRAQQAEQQALQDQANIRANATSAVGQTTRAIANDSPGAIANSAGGQYVAALRQNGAGAPGGAGSALAPAIGADPRYAADVAKSRATVQNYGDSRAAQMGATDAAVRMRQNEGLKMQDLGTNLNTLGAQSATTNYVDQLRAQAANTPSPWASMLSGVLGGAGNTLSKNWAPSAPPSTLVSNKYSGGSGGNVTAG